MPTIKLHGGKVVLKNGKPSCECCSSQTCSYGIAAGVHVELTQAQYIALYAGGTLTASASGSGNSSGYDPGFGVTVNALASGTALRIYSIMPQTCSIALGSTSGTPSSSVSPSGNSTEDGGFGLTFAGDDPFGSMSVEVGNYRIYDGAGGLFQRGMFISASASFEFGCNSTWNLGSFPIGFATERNTTTTANASGSGIISFSINGETLNIPATTSANSPYNDPGTSSLFISLSFVSSAP